MSIDVRSLLEKTSKFSHSRDWKISAIQYKYNLIYSLSDVIYGSNYVNPSLLSSALMRASECGNTEDAKFLIECGANIYHNSNDWCGFSIDFAVRNGHLECLIALLENTKDLSSKSEELSKPLGYNNHETLLKLINMGASIEEAVHILFSR